MKTTKTNAAVKETGEAQTDGKKRITAYAWSYDDTWIITRDKKQVMPRGSHLFAILDCIATNDDIRTKSTYPTVGDVVSDSKGQKLLIEGYRRVIKK